MAEIFISYRRHDTGGHAGRLRDHLRGQFGDLVFQDVDDIPDGAVFETVLASALSSAKVGVVVIGPQWLTSVDAAGRRRLDDPKDWVRTEIRELLERNIPVIPVLVGGLRSLEADALPDDLRPLAGRQIRVLSDESWSSGVEALTSRLSTLVGAPRKRRTVRMVGVAGAITVVAALAWAVPRWTLNQSEKPGALDASISTPARDSSIAMFAAAEALGALGPWEMDDFSGMEVDSPTVHFELRQAADELLLVPVDGADRTPWRVARLVGRAFVFEFTGSGASANPNLYSFQLSTNGTRLQECQTLDRTTLGSLGACSWRWVRPSAAKSTDPTCGSASRDIDPACVDVARTLALIGAWREPRGLAWQIVWQIVEQGDLVRLVRDGAKTEESMVLLKVVGREVSFAPVSGSGNPPELDAQISIHFELSADGRRLMRCRQRMLLGSGTDEETCPAELPAALQR